MAPQKKTRNKAMLKLAVLVLIIGGLLVWKVNKENTEEVHKKTSAPVTTEDSKELDSLLQELDSTEGGAEINIDNIE